jgi:hypothetical protein
MNKITEKYMKEQMNGEGKMEKIDFSGLLRR